jgi:hypothetical protein
VSTAIEIGTWHEREARELTRCPSYYAADHETVVTKPGDYPVRVTFEGGYLVPMPYWLVGAIPAVRKSGALYSGFGGNNFASTKLPAGEEVSWSIQSYVYEISKFVEDGRLTLKPGFEWLLEKVAFNHPNAPKSWDAVRALTVRA